MTSASTLAIGALLITSSVTQATVIGFGGIGGSNTQIPTALGSAATADGTGFSVSNGSTPNIDLTWDSSWDIHTSSHFNSLENITNGGSWDKTGSDPEIAQLDMASHTIGFVVDAGFALVLNSFDIADTVENVDTTTWVLTLTDESASTAWTETVVIDNSLGQNAVTITPGFSGVAGEDYTLTFTRTGGLDGNSGIDNLSFSQVPEPSSAALLAFGGFALILHRQK